MKKILKVAIIGLGAQSLNDHIPSILKRDDLILVAVCDPAPRSQQKFKELYSKLASQVKIYSDFREIIAKQAYDFAIVAVPHQVYPEVVQLLCEQKKFFMKEKPLARNLVEAKSLLEIPEFKKYGFICTQRRFSKLYLDAKNRINLLGKIYAFNVTYRLNVPHINKAGWRGNTELAGGGCILDMGYHVIDQIVWLFGLPTQLFAQTSALAVTDVEYDAEDFATIAMRYDSGMHGSIILSEFAGEKHEECLLYGSNGSLSVNKKKLVMRDSLGNIIYEASDGDSSSMTDNQLSFFIDRLRSGSDFSDLQAHHLMIMQFIDLCYKEAGR